VAIARRGLPRYTRTWLRTRCKPRPIARRGRLPKPFQRSRLDERKPVTLQFPDRRKLTRDDFNAMVREILDDTFALFSISGFRKAVARGSGSRPPAIARLEFLRSRIERLESVVATIVGNQRRMLTAEETALPYHRATRATGLEVLRTFGSGRIMHEAGEPSRLPAPLKGTMCSDGRSINRPLSSGGGSPTTPARIIFSS
jgi:hypothetical protein